PSPSFLCLFFFFFHYHLHYLNLHSFPTRRSSDLPHHQYTYQLVNTCLQSHDLLILCHFYYRHNVRNTRKNQPTAALYSFLSLQRSEEHTSELQSRFDLVCRLLLEKKKIIKKIIVL